MFILKEIICARLRGKYLLLIIFAVVMFSACHVGAAVYYVDQTGGNDSWTGVSTDNLPVGTGPWKTVAKVSDSTFTPGDSILFKRGEVWHERLTIPSSGTAGNPITYGAYGGGARPLIDVGETADHCIYLDVDTIGDSINYVVIREFDVKHGTGASFYIAHHAGTAGVGYTIEVRDIRVLENWGGDLILF